MSEKYIKLTNVGGTEYFCVPAEDLARIGLSYEQEAANANLEKINNDLQLKVEQLEQDIEVQSNVITDLSGRLVLAEDTIEKVNELTAPWVDPDYEVPDEEEPDEEEPTDGDTIIVMQGDSIQEAIDRAERGDIVLLTDGVHTGTMDFSARDGITVRAEGEAIIDNMSRLNAAWTQFNTEGVFYAEYTLPENLWTWQGDHPGDAFNNQLMFPLLIAVASEGAYTPLLYVDTIREELEPGQFTYSAASGRLYAYPFFEDDLSAIYVSEVDRVVWGDEDTTDCALKNLTFIGCSNTGKTGAINTPGAGWKLTNITVDLVNTIGIELGQGGDKSDMRSQLSFGTFSNVVVKRAGQMGWWGSAFDSTFDNCGHIGSNWRGFDHWWEGSHKLENTHSCTFTEWFAHDCNGPGFWFDGVRGGNTYNRLVNARISDCARAGIDLELGTSFNVIENPSIVDIRVESPNPAQNWSVAYGIGFKANCLSNTVTGGMVDGANSAIRLDNEDERDVPKSDANVVSGLVAKDISDEPVKVLGALLTNTFEVEVN